jgi:hypothetical protein
MTAFSSRRRQPGGAGQGGRRIDALRPFRLQKPLTLADMSNEDSAATPFVRAGMNAIRVRMNAVRAGMNAVVRL